MYFDKSQDSFQKKEEVDRHVRRFRERCAGVEIDLDKLLRGRILDAGCGFGYFTMHLQNGGIDCYGVDVDHSAVREAKSRVKHPDKILQGDLETPPFEEGFFDVAFSSMVYDSIELIRGTNLAIRSNFDRSFDPEAQTKAEKDGAIRGVHRILKPGGVYLIFDNLRSMDDMSLDPFKVLYNEGGIHLILQK